METTNSHRLYISPEDRPVLDNGEEISTLEFSYTITPEDEVDDMLYLSFLKGHQSTTSLPTHLLSLNRVKSLHAFLSAFLDLQPKE